MKIHFKFPPYWGILGIVAAGLGMAATSLLAADASDEKPEIREKTLAPAPFLRIIKNFNRDWKFELGDHPGAEEANFDDSGWDIIGLPHSFSIPYFLSSKFYVGYGWYRKHFEVPVKWKEKRIFLECDGAFQDTEVFVNGRSVGHHSGGYTGFSIDLTDAVRTGDNLVAIRLNNNWNPEIAPRAGEHVFSGGLYRNVRLVVTDPLHVAWYGTFVTTPKVSKESGIVDVKTEVVNDGHETASASVKTSVIDDAGKVIVEVESSQTVPAGQTVVFDQKSPPIPSPRLWSPDHPNLYTVKTTLMKGGKAVDDFISPLGFRWFEFTAERGFFLNGEHYYFKGANVHQDHAGWGDAVTSAGAERDVKLVKDAGFDFIRGSHYPHAPAFADACDRLGILFWSENCFWGTGGFKSPWGGSAYPVEAIHQAAFEESVKDSLRDMIRINRNHPSIIVWSMDNEVFFSGAGDKVKKFLGELISLSHQLDPTRPAAIGGAQRGGIDKIGDVAGYNGDGARIFMNPGIPNVVTEYGGTIAIRPGKYEPGWGDLHDKDQDKSQPYPWRYPWRSGEVIWCAFDHGSLGGNFGSMGMIDYFRLPKRQWYWYRNEYRHIPQPEWPASGTSAGLRLSADKNLLASPDGLDDAQIVVAVIDASGKQISNSPPVTLTVESGPGEFPTGTSITFSENSDIAIRDGLAAIEFRSYHGGKSLIRATSPGLKDATLEITTLGEPKFLDGTTPAVKSRPYVRFSENDGGSKNGASLGLNNPSKASSELANHLARLANDGNPATFWQAADSSSGAWWQVDLERLVTISEVQLTFPKETDCHYKVEVSEDGIIWKLASDQSGTETIGTIRTDNVKTDKLSQGSKGRFVRVVFTNNESNPATLSEIKVFGTISDR